MDSHVYPVPIPSLTLSVHRQLYVIELDTQSILNACECDDVERIKKRLHYRLFIHNEANTTFDGTLVHTDSHFLIAFPYSGTLPVSFLTYEFSINTHAETFQVLCKHHKFIEPLLSTNVSLTIERTHDVYEESDGPESDEVVSSEEEEDAVPSEVEDEQEETQDEVSQQNEDDEDNDHASADDTERPSDDDDDNEPDDDGADDDGADGDDDTVADVGNPTTEKQAQPTTKCRVTVTAEDVLSTMAHK